MTDPVDSAARIPVPRDVTWHDRHAMLGVLLPRLLIIPHALVAVALVFLMISRFLWMLLGSNVLVDVDRVWSSRTSKGQTVYHVSWSLPRGGGREQHSEQITCAQVDELSLPGAVVPVRVLDRVGVHYSGLWLPVRSVGGLLFFPFVFGLFWIGLTGFFVYVLYVKPARLRDLLVRGTPTVGTVTGKRSEQKGRAVVYHVDYRYQTTRGQRDGQTTLTRKERWLKASAGDRVLVFYDPERPERSVAHGYGSYRVVGLP